MEGLWAVGLQGGGEGLDFCVGQAGFAVPAGGEEDVIFHDDGADGWVRRGFTDSVAGCCEGEVHPVRVVHLG